MKKAWCILLFAWLLIGCRDQKEQKQEMIPVEADGGIGDGAPSLDSLLHEEKKLDTMVPTKTNDSL